MREIELTVEKPEHPEAERIDRTDSEGAFPAFRWAATRYGWVVVAAAVVGGLIASLLPGVAGGDRYETAAVVSARDLTIDPEQLPQTASAIFGAGEVAAETARAAQVDLDPAVLVPEHLRLEPVESTVVMRVVGSHANPETAARLANEGARSLVVELQRLGAGVGRFAVHTPADVPQDPVASGPLPPLLMGASAGALFGIGLVGLVLAIRRPVTSARTLRNTLDLPILGRLALSGLDASGDLRMVPNLRSTTTALFPRGEERRFLVGVKVGGRTMRLLGMVLARSLARSGKAALVGRGVTRQPFGTEDEHLSLFTSEGESPSPGMPTVVLGRFAPDDAETTIRPSDGWVLVVGKGAPLHRVRRAMMTLEDLPVVGVIYLRPLGLGDVARRQNPQLV